MAIFNSTDQYRYTGKGPLDAKALVAKFNNLTQETTWKTKVINPSTGAETEVFTAYNGMIVAVWQDTDTLNGIYFLQDPQVKTALAKPNVVESANWHKMGGLGGLPGLEAQIAELASGLETISTSVSSLESVTTGIQEGLAGVQADVATLKNNVQDLQTNIPTIQVIDGGDADN